MEALEKFTKLDCERNEYGSAKILFEQAYNPNVILGATKDVYPISRNISEHNQTDPEVIKNNQMYDVLLEYRCPDIWLVRASKTNTIITEDQLKEFTVDPKNNCKRNVEDGEEIPDKLNSQEKQKDTTLYTRFNFTLFSMFVSGSFLAGYSVKSFYILVAYGLSGTVRLTFIFGTWKGFVYEITHPDPIIKVMEACYMYRFE